MFSSLDITCNDSLRDVDGAASRNLSIESRRAAYLKTPVRAHDASRAIEQDRDLRRVVENALCRARIRAPVERSDNASEFIDHESARDQRRLVPAARVDQRERRIRLIERRGRRLQLVAAAIDGDRCVVDEQVPASVRLYLRVVVARPACTEDLEPAAIESAVERANLRSE